MSAFRPTYAPYANNQLKSFYTGTGTYAGAHSDGANVDKAQALVNAAPQLAKPVSALVNFASWLRASYPDLAKAVVRTRPGILDAAHIVSKAAASGKLAGLGGDEYDDNPYDGVATTDTSGWANTINNALNAVLQTYSTVQRQQVNDQLLRTNIDRASRGLPPITTNMVNPSRTGLTISTPLLIGGALLAFLVLRK